MERGAWTDERLDDFRERVEFRFDSVENRMRDGFDRVDRDIRELRGSVEELHTGLFRVGGALMVGLVGVIAAILTTG